MTATAHATLDHLVVAADTLENGEDHLEALLGVRPQRGGRHAAMGTHNSLVKLGPRCYLELIAIDPDATTPARPRWFDLDRPAMRALLAKVPRLVHWVARTSDIEGSRRACAVDPGTVHAMARGSFRWRITIPDDGHRPGDGVLPTLIQWESRHPADDLPDTGLRIAALAAAHPEPGPVRAALAALGLGETLKVTFAAAPRLAAMLSTPRGKVTL
ncbi:MAG: VOC family protein [Casimicrobiaceae bacterium]